MLKTIIVFLDNHLPIKIAVCIGIAALIYLIFHALGYSIGKVIANLLK